MDAFLYTVKLCYLSLEPVSARKKQDSLVVHSLMEGVFHVLVKEQTDRNHSVIFPCLEEIPYPIRLRLAQMDRKLKAPSGWSAGEQTEICQLRHLSKKALAIACWQ